MRILLLALVALTLLTSAAGAGPPPHPYSDPVYNRAVVNSMIGSRPGDTLEEVMTGVPRRP